jgi:2-oxoglutarate dehydrogenase E1 component
LAKLQKKFDVLKLIEGYRVRGHLFTKTNPVRDRRTLSNTRYRKFRTFICRSWDRFLMPLEVIGCTLLSFRNYQTLDSIYCQHIGIEYMYIRKPEIVQWIQNKLTGNQPLFSVEKKNDSFEIK